MPTRRQIQVADEIQQIVSVLLQRDLKDPRIGFATVTAVEITSDFKYARIFVSVMGTPQEQKEAMQAFGSARGWFRRELAHRMTIRAVPEVQFKLDTSIEYSDNISRLLNELKEAESRKEPAEESTQEGTSEDTSEEAQEEGK